MNIDNLVGMTLGNRYDMLEKIGTGGMATVYKAKDTLLNRFVAIKILRDSLEDEKNVVSNFIKEAQSSASLVHNNIVSVYDVGEEDGLNYMVMEYVDGITLKEYIKHKGALPWQEACDFAIQIAQGISEAHSINIIHRDIKPQNILMTKDKTLKVTDFGIARAVAGETTVVGGSALGSVHYISPEQARGGFTDARSDIYSLGVVMYEMLTGKVPFDGDSAVSVALMHLEKEPVNVKCVNMDIPTDLAYVTMKAISKEQRARYQDVQELVNDLHAVLADEPLPSREEMYKRTMQEQDEDTIETDGFDSEDIDVPEILDNEDEDIQPRGRSNRKKESKKKNKKQKKEDRIASVLAISTVAVILLVALGAFFIVNMSKESVVPDFTNMTIEEAKAAAEDAGLNIADEIEYSLSDTVAENCVISQDPEAKKVVKKNSDIKLIVSIGSSGGDIPAPDVEGMSFDDAVVAIIEAGLNYTVKEEYSDEVQEGYIIRQTPLGGTKLDADDSINLHVSKGKEEDAEATPAAEKVSVPSIIGLGREQAEATLKANGLNLGSVSRGESSAPEGTVISQSPELGKTAAKGSFVSIVLSRGQAEETASEEQVTETTDTSAESGGEEQSTGSETTVESNTSSGTGSDNTSTESATSTRTFTVKIPDTANDTVDVEIVVNGRSIYNATHSKDEGTVSIDITSSGTAEVQAYIDGSKVSDKTINFSD
ncbi:MAG: Stk1 family PASTA domain-containing Ser/Thr kinase [Oscillospiraceae bacterium]|nr:Stk1 family PASTA domain-containing Ser/Thr kinase [Oscillospiraceae bacterium]